MDDYTQGKWKLRVKQKPVQNRKRAPTLNRETGRRDRGTNKGDKEETVFKKHQGLQETGAPGNHRKSMFSKEGGVNSTDVSDRF